MKRPKNGSPWRTPVSVRLTVVARTLTRTSLSLGTGRSTSASRRTSGGPYLSKTTALISSRPSGSRARLRGQACQVLGVPANVVKLAWPRPAALPRTRQKPCKSGIQRTGPRPVTSVQPVAAAVTGRSQCGGPQSAAGNEYSSRRGRKSAVPHRGRAHRARATAATWCQAAGHFPVLAVPGWLPIPRPQATPSPGVAHRGGPPGPGARGRLPQDVDRPGDHQPQDGQGSGRLHGHGRLGPPGERHHIGRAERSGVGEAEIEVIKELGTPTWWGHNGVELFGESKVGEL